MLEGNREYFKDDPDLREYIIEQIRQKLGEGFEPSTSRFIRAWHETCNPLGIWSNSFVMTSDGVQSEDVFLMRSKDNQALAIIKARSLDCAMLRSNSKGRLSDRFL